mmetsp:Transcript_149410/g.263779  ORF Transcript_149410/g.263779 Transcript_149410/m.263779 type:complete len:171 (+) Transcript_149410:3-515(+)
MDTLLNLQWGPMAELGVPTKSRTLQQFTKKGFGRLSNEMVVQALCFAMSTPKIRPCLMVCPIIPPKIVETRLQVKQQYLHPIEFKGQSKQEGGRMHTKQAGERDILRKRCIDIFHAGQARRPRDTLSEVLEERHAVHKHIPLELRETALHRASKMFARRVWHQDLYIAQL